MNSRIVLGRQYHCDDNELVELSALHQNARRYMFCIGYQILNSHKGRHMIDFGLGKLRLWSAAAACAALFMTQAAGAHPAAFTLNDVMQAPFPYDMVAAPTGAAVISG
jgi:hypothetical protein